MPATSVAPCPGSASLLDTLEPAWSVSWLTTLPASTNRSRPSERTIRHALSAHGNAEPSDVGPTVVALPTAVISAWAAVKVETVGYRAVGMEVGVATPGRRRR